MDRKMFSRVQLWVCVPLSLFAFFLVSTTALCAGGGGSIAGKCILCHAPIIAEWRQLPHGGGTSRSDGGTGVATDKKPLACKVCHASSFLRGKPLLPKDSIEVCGNCHLKPGTRTAVRINSGDWNASKHAKAGVTCLSCHALHRPAESPLLRKSGDELCVECHSKMDQHKSMSLRIDATKGNCLSCHDPHGGKQGGLYANAAGGASWQFKDKTVHKPVAEGKCTDCHLVHKSLPTGVAGGRSTQPDDDEDEPAGPVLMNGLTSSLLSKPSAVICYDCHQDKQALFLASRHARIGDKVQPKQENACAACHLPHSSQYAHLTTYQGSRLCLTCHPEKTPHHFLSSASVSQAKLECTQCHNPHGSTHPAFLLREKEQICALCHKK